MFVLEMYKNKNDLQDRKITISHELNNLKQLEEIAKATIRDENFYQGIIHDENEIIESITDKLEVNNYITREIANLYIGFIYQCCTNLNLNDDNWYRFRGGESTDEILLDINGSKTKKVNNNKVSALLSMFLRNVGDLIRSKYIASIVFNAKDVVEHNNLFMYYRDIKGQKDKVGIFIRK